MIINETDRLLYTDSLWIMRFLFGVGENNSWHAIKKLLHAGYPSPKINTRKAQCFANLFNDERLEGTCVVTVRYYAFSGGALCMRPFWGPLDKHECLTPRVKADWLSQVRAVSELKFTDMYV